MMQMRNGILELWRPLGQSGFQPPEACVNVSLQSNRVAGVVASIHMGDDAAWSSCARIEGEPCKDGDRSRVHSAVRGRGHLWQCRGIH